jgi:hypothetical protein
LRRVVWQKFTDVSEVLVASMTRAMMKETASSSEMSVNFYQTTRRNNPLHDQGDDDGGSKLL